MASSGGSGDRSNRGKHCGRDNGGSNCSGSIVVNDVIHRSDDCSRDNGSSGSYPRDPVLDLKPVKIFGFLTVDRLK